VLSVSEDCVVLCDRVIHELGFGLSWPGVTKKTVTNLGTADQADIGTRNFLNTAIALPQHQSIWQTVC
jgi:hypothetical protein